jgi:cobalamin biosynthesis Mg chelatase CobN
MSVERNPLRIRAIALAVMTAPACTGDWKPDARDEVRLHDVWLQAVNRYGRCTTEQERVSQGLRRQHPNETFSPNCTAEAHESEVRTEEYQRYLDRKEGSAETR